MADVRTGGPGAAQRPPNILVVMTDQQRFNSLGCTGADWVRTPHLDRLAGEGVLFSNCYAPNPVCTPSRASMLTGRHLPGHGVYQLHDILPADEVLFTRRLQEMGYATALFGKLHVSGRIYEAAQRHPNDGFDVYEWCLESSLHLESPFNGYAAWLKEHHPEYLQELAARGRRLLHPPREVHMTHWAAERTIDYIRRHDGRKPFFCLMSVFDPHNPYEGYPEESRSTVDEAKLPDPLPERVPEERRPYGIRQEHEHSYLGPFRKFGREDLRAMRLGYHASIGLFDQEVGRVLAALEEQGLAEETLVIFTSDHGDMLGDHGLLVKGAFFYDPCVKVPLILRWPGRLPAGRRVDGLVQLQDLAATVLAAAGAGAGDLGRWMPESRDLAPDARGEQSGREQAVCCYRNSGICDRWAAWDPPIHATMLREGRWKLNLYHRVPGRMAGPEGQLFDLEADPLELDDRWDDPRAAGERRRLTEALLDWLHGQELGRGGRGGEATPAASQRLVNALKVD